MQSMQVTVFGASGRVGRLVVAQLLDAGHDVVAVVHRHAPFAADPHLAVRHADIHDAVAVAQAVRGADAVISTLGSWGTRDKSVLSAGMATITPAMQAAGLKRLVTLTGHDARAPGDQLSLLHRLAHFSFGHSPYGKILYDGERHIAMLWATDLDWTVLRSPLMYQRGHAAPFRLVDVRPQPWARIHRQAVAEALVELATHEGYIRQAPYITRKRKAE